MNMIKIVKVFNHASVIALVFFQSRCSKNAKGVRRLENGTKLPVFTHQGSLWSLRGGASCVLQRKERLRGIPLGGRAFNELPPGGWRLTTPAGTFARFVSFWMLRPSTSRVRGNLPMPRRTPKRLKAPVQSGGPGRFCRKIRGFPRL
jgi:hypothetical protein